MRHKKSSSYRLFLQKIMGRFGGVALAACLIVAFLYLAFWRRQAGDWIVSFLQRFAGMSAQDAFTFYHHYFRENKSILVCVAVLVVFLVLLRLLFIGLIRYFNEIDEGIDALLREDEGDICLPREMEPLEQKLNAVKKILWQQKREAREAQQRKNELVMYLAHDLRTPLTSVIGYLTLLKEDSTLTAEQRAKYTQISLDKAERLEKMINEFFEITRYHTQQIQISCEKVDLYYLLAQVIDEHTPTLAARGNRVELCAAENIFVKGDGEKLARVFNNILKNAAAYSDPKTLILVGASCKDGKVTVSIQNRGKTVPADKLGVLFERFYRLDEARASDTGGAGLGLAIAKEIVILHEGKIWAESEGGYVIFRVELPGLCSLDS